MALTAARSAIGFAEPALCSAVRIAAGLPSVWSTSRLEMVRRLESKTSELGLFEDCSSALSAWPEPARGRQDRTACRPPACRRDPAGSGTGCRRRPTAPGRAAGGCSCRRRSAGPSDKVVGGDRPPWPEQRRRGIERIARGNASLTAAWASAILICVRMKSRSLLI